MADLRAMLADGRVLVADGAMGTMLYERGVFVNVCYDELNATHPELVGEVHAQYVRAGADILETNTFGANPVKLSSYRLEDRTEELNRRAVEIAVRAGGDGWRWRARSGHWGFASSRSAPLRWRKHGSISAVRWTDCSPAAWTGSSWRPFSDLAELEQAFRAVKSRCDLPVIVQVTVEGDEAKTASGASVEQAALAADGWGASVVGLNCSVGPAVVLEALEGMARVTSLPLAAQPNAGLPTAVRERKMYLTRPDYMARYARRLIDAGARIVGGCCGTTPEHIRSISEQVAASRPRTVSVRVAPETAVDAGGNPTTPLAKRSAFGRRLAQGDFVTSVQVLPPRGWDTAALVRDCRALAAAGANVIAVQEDRGGARLDVFAAASAIARSCGGVEPLVHYTCRDRKLSRMMSDLLGAAAAGLHNVLLLTGEPPGPGPYPDYRSVVDVDSIGLTNVVTGLNAGVGPSGNDLGDPAGFVVGVAVNQAARDRIRELGRFHWKADAGADFVVTRPVFDVGQLREFLAETERQIPVIAGIVPLENSRQAEFLQNEVPGVQVPDRVVERMRRAEDGGAGRAAAEGVAIAREVAGELRGEVAGFHISAVREDVEIVLGVVEGLGNSHSSSGQESVGA